MKLKEKNYNRIINFLNKSEKSNFVKHNKRVYGILAIIVSVIFALQASFCIFEINDDQKRISSLKSTLQNSSSINMQSSGENTFRESSNAYMNSNIENLKSLCESNIEYFNTEIATAKVIIPIFYSVSGILLIAGICLIVFDCVSFKKKADAEELK